MLKSPNCALYTDVISTLVTGVAEVPGGGDDCKLTLPSMWSCQTENMEEPDDASRSALTDRAAEMLRAKGCEVDKMSVLFETNQVGTQIEYPPEKLVELGMASNCFREGNDSNRATHNATARCSPQYDMTHRGAKVRNTNMHFLSNLVTCDVSDEAVPQLMEDLRKVAWYNAKQNGYELDTPKHLACQHSILPVL